jgi:hypothetical protein
MKHTSIFAISLAGNLVLMVAFMASRQTLHFKLNRNSTDLPLLSAKPTGQPVRAAAGDPTTKVPWRLIESADYRRYVANLRAVGCPEWLVRDIIVADVDDLYEKKYRTDPVYSPPWQDSEQRRSILQDQSAKRKAMRRGKVELIKFLLGFEWDDHADQMWNWDLKTSLTLGFLPDEKASQLLELKDQYIETAQNIREDANYIIIDDDRARLQAVYDEYKAALRQLLDVPQLDELQLRAQQSFLIAHDIHFDGVNISQEELRELVRISTPLQDMARGEFLPDHPPAPHGEADLQAELATMVENLLGPQRFNDYQRAQDINFRQILAFSLQNKLSLPAAVGIYNSRLSAEQQAQDIQNDSSLSQDEQGTALVVLKSATMDAISPALGSSFKVYLEGPGQWLETLAPAAKMQPPQIP